MHIVLVYKPPTVQINDFLLDIKKAINISNSEETYILGDFNIDLMKKDALCRELNALMHDNNFQQLIDKPNRTTDNTATLIDCFFTNKAEINTQHGVLEIGISDHELIYTCR